MELEKIDLEKVIDNFRAKQGLSSEKNESDGAEAIIESRGRMLSSIVPKSKAGFLSPVYRCFSAVERTYEELRIFLLDVSKPHYSCSFGRMSR